MVTDTRKLSLIPEEVTFSIDDRTFVVKEATEGTAKEYENEVVKATTLGPDGKPTKIDGLAHASTRFLARCLFERVTNGDGKTTDKPITETALKAWPSRTTKPLLLTAFQISGMRAVDDEEKKEQEDEVKNSLSATTASSV